MHVLGGFLLSDNIIFVFVVVRWSIKNCILIYFFTVRHCIGGICDRVL